MIIDQGAKTMRDKQLVNNKGQIVDQDAFNTALNELMVSKFKGGAEKQSKTFKGMWSTVTGVTKTSLANIVGMQSDGTVRQGSMYEQLRERIKVVADTMQKWQNDGTIQKIADNVTQAVNRITSTIQSIIAVSAPVFKFMVDNWGTIAPIIMTVVGAMTLYKGIMVAQVAYTKAFAAAEFIKNAVLATGAASVNAVTIAQWAWNAAMTANPIGLVIAGIAALITAGILLKDHFSSIIEKLAELFKYFGKIKDIAGKTWGSIKNFFGGNGGPAVPTTGGMDTYASGGIANRPSIFGEAGPEIAIPLNNSGRSQELLNVANKKIGNQSKGGQSIVININGDTYGFDDFKNKVTQAVYEAVNNKINNMA
jgi:hypothetical protein